MDISGPSSTAAEATTAPAAAPTSFASASFTPASFAPIRAIGLMSGTSLDGIDAACLETDGESIATPGPHLTLPYSPDFRERLRGSLGGRGDVKVVERELTLLHADAVAALRLQAPGWAAALAGFHGHTILHQPEARRTWQIGDGALLAQRLGIPVIADFRSADIAAGGEGAPLVPLFHAAIAASLPKPLAILNIGGVANVTWLGEPGTDPEILAFDTGPGNAPIDDWVRRHSGAAADFGGRFALAGQADTSLVQSLLAHPYFPRQPPKSLDRDAFGSLLPDTTGLEDGAATLTEIIAAAVAASASHFPSPARRWLVCGGGRHNPAVMAALQRRLGVPVEAIETAGWNGDALEAQAFAYLAVRSLRGLPLSLPSTTGVPHPMRGGRYFGA